MCLPSRFLSLSIASAPFRKEPLERYRRLSRMSHMISGESAPGFLIHLPLKACRLCYQIHASQSALDAQITREGVSRNRNVDSILEKIADFFDLPRRLAPPRPRRSRQKGRLRARLRRPLPLLPRLQKSLRSLPRNLQIPPLPPPAPAGAERAGGSVLPPALLKALHHCPSSEWSPRPPVVPSMNGSQLSSPGFRF